MLQVARLAPTLLAGATERVTEFFGTQAHEGGGFRDRAGNQDLYYSVFGLEGLLALQVSPPTALTTAYLSGFGDGSALDFVHGACLARCWASLDSAMDPADARGLVAAIETCRTTDGGYGPHPEAEHGTIYHSFLALGVYQDLGLTLPDPEGILRVVEGLRTSDGGYANEPNLPMGTTPTTAAAITLFRHLGAPIPEEAGDWLLARAHRDGGFMATCGIELPDLLSTATALHALSGMRVSWEHLREPGLDFLDSLWTGKAFCGSWLDEAEDIEYTYYALLALGHLSL